MHGPMLLAVDITADAAAIHRAIATQAGEAAFWTPDCDVQPVVGSVARFGFAKAPVDLRMRIEELDPARIRWTCLGDFPFWADTRIVWDIRPAATGSGSTVAFRHEGWADGYSELEYAATAYTWARILGALKAYLESGTPQPFLG